MSAGKQHSRREHKDTLVVARRRFASSREDNPSCNTSVLDSGGWWTVLVVSAAEVDHTVAEGVR